MILSRKWLEDYVDTKDISNKEFCDAMTLSGSKVEEYKTEGSELENIVVGRIDSLERHPDSDHLWICNVNIGKGEDVQIVTGAQKPFRWGLRARSASRRNGLQQARALP